MISALLKRSISTHRPRNPIETLLLSYLFAIHLPLCSQRLGAYNVSKAAILGLTKTLSLELGPKDIRVNCLVPGTIDTAFSKVVKTKDNFCSCPTECQGPLPYQAMSQRHLALWTLVLMLWFTAFGISSRIRIVVLCEGRAETRVSPRSPSTKVFMMWSHCDSIWMSSTNPLTFPLAV